MNLDSDGEAGGEARRKHEKFEDELRKRHESRRPFQKFLAVLFDADTGLEKRSEAWQKGAIGEAAIGRELEALANKYEFVVLHDRKILGSSANIDHLLVTTFGVFVIDSKNYKGMVRIDSGSALDFFSKETLYVGNRNQSKLVDGVKKQISIVKAVLASDFDGVPVVGVLAFYEAEFPLLFRPVEIGGVLINGKGLEKAIMSKAGSAAASKLLDVNRVAQLLKAKFPLKK